MTGMIASELLAASAVAGEAAGIDPAAAAAVASAMGAAGLPPGLAGLLIHSLRQRRGQGGRARIGVRDAELEPRAAARALANRLAAGRSKFFKRVGDEIKRMRDLARSARILPHEAWRKELRIKLQKDIVALFEAHQLMPWQQTQEQLEQQEQRMAALPAPIPVAVPVLTRAPRPAQPPALVPCATTKQAAAVVNAAFGIARHSGRVRRPSPRAVSAVPRPGHCGRRPGGGSQRLSVSPTVASDASEDTGAHLSWHAQMHRPTTAHQQLARSRTGVGASAATSDSLNSLCAAYPGRTAAAMSDSGEASSAATFRAPRLSLLGGPGQGLCPAAGAVGSTAPAPAGTLLCMLHTAGDAGEVAWVSPRGDVPPRRELGLQHAPNSDSWVEVQSPGPRLFDYYSPQSTPPTAAAAAAAMPSDTLQDCRYSSLITYTNECMVTDEQGDALLFDGPETMCDALLWRTGAFLLPGEQGPRCDVSS